mgnify:CR=1 FL=1
MYKKSKKEIQDIMPIMKMSFLTKNLQDDEIEKVIGSMKPENFRAGETIIKYGDEGITYYILTEGKVKVTVYEPGTNASDEDLKSKEKFNKFMDYGCGFGELALLYNDKRSATITAVEDCLTYTLDGNLFKKIIINSSINKRNREFGFLETIKLFSNLDKF